MQIEIARICTPTDFSETADQAVRYGAALAEKFAAELHLLHVLDDIHDVVMHPDMTAHGDAIRTYFNRLERAAGAEPAEAEDEDEEVKQFLNKLATGVEERFRRHTEDAWWEKVNVVRTIRYGHPVEEICRYARRQGIHLLVLGTHGRGGMKRLLVGSVAERVVRAAPCPVLTVRHPEHEFVFD